MKPLVATGRDRGGIGAEDRATCGRASPSTPRRRISRRFDHHGLGELADELKLLSRAQRWEEMPQHITDDILETFVTVGTYDGSPRKLCDRYGGVVTHCEFSIPVKSAADKERLRALAKAIQGEGVPPGPKGDRRLECVLIILFTDHEKAQPPKSCWRRRKANGASELAVPKRTATVVAYPAPGSGKTDYVVLQRMAAERFAEQKAA